MGQPKLRERVPNRDNMIHMGIELSGTCGVYALCLYAPTRCKRSLTKRQRDRDELIESR